MFLRIARWVPANGVLFVVLVVIAGLIVDTPGENATDASWAAYYADGGNRTAEEISLLLIGLSVFCFLSFLGSLRGALARVEGEPARLSTVVAASGAAFIALAAAGHAVATAMSWARSFYGGDDYDVDPNLARTLTIAGYLFLVLALFAAAAMTLAATVLTLQLRAFPRWLAWLGSLATVGGVLGVFVWPSVLILLWIVAVSLYLLRPEGPAREAPRATT